MINAISDLFQTRPRTQNEDTDAARPPGAPRPVEETGTPFRPLQPSVVMEAQWAEEHRAGGAGVMEGSPEEVASKQDQ